MEINWLGYSCFRIKGKNATIITDPIPVDSSRQSNRSTADIVCLSHQLPEESGLERIGGDPYIISGPGEYEVHNVLIIGVGTYRDEASGSLRGKNTVYALEIDEFSVCHLGNLGHLLTDQQVEVIGHVDILLVPVGGHSTINAAQAARLVRTIEPKIVIPMHYKTPTCEIELDPVDKFLAETGSQGLGSQAKLNVSKNSLPLSTQVFLLDCQA